ncbi:hypothetical protein HanRHA438_Chr03g0135061 [Helianthus annuus]|nr:hypothetical protein HanRHA438_Chr03g0135061 [Helianthus annuus]
MEEDLRIDFVEGVDSDGWKYLVVLLRRMRLWQDRDIRAFSSKPSKSVWGVFKI